MQLADTESFPWRKYMVLFLRVSGHIFVNWSIHNLVLSVFLFKDSLFNTHRWFITIELMPEESSSNSCIFTVLLLQTLDSTSTLHLGAVLNSEITNKKHKNANNMVLNRQKDTCLQYESWTVKADVA